MRSTGLEKFGHKWAAVAVIASSMVASGGVTPCIAANCNSSRDQLVLSVVPLEEANSNSPRLTGTFELRLLRELGLDHDSRLPVPCGRVETINSDFSTTTSPKDIIARAPKGSALILWGNYTIEPKLLFQSNLAFSSSNDNRRKHPELWTVRIGKTSVTYNPLRRMYSFSPFELKLPSSNEAGGYRLCAEKGALVCNERRFDLGDIEAFTGDGSYGHVTLKNGAEGWIYLP